MRFWANLIGYQIVWFCAVVGAGSGVAWPGVLAAALFVAWQLALSPHRAVDTRLLLLALALGVVVDGMLAWRGWGSYAAAWPFSSFAPLWILALWAAFSQTLTQSLAFLQRDVWIGILFGAIGGPLAYLGASRGFDAVTLLPPEWHGIAWLASGWGVAMPLLSQAARRWTQAAHRSTTHPIGAAP